jgi:hypothetical protein
VISRGSSGRRNPQDNQSKIHILSEMSDKHTQPRSTQTRGCTHRPPTDGEADTPSATAETPLASTDSFHTTPTGFVGDGTPERPGDGCSTELGGVHVLLVSGPVA